MDERGKVKLERRKYEVAVLTISLVLLVSTIWIDSALGHMLTAVANGIMFFFYNRISSKEFLVLYVKGMAIYQFGTALYEIVSEEWELWESVEVTGNFSFGCIGWIIAIVLAVLILICCLYRMLHIKKASSELGDDQMQKMSLGQSAYVHLGIVVILGLSAVYGSEGKAHKDLIMPITYTLLLSVAYAMGAHTANMSGRFEERKVLEMLSAGWNSIRSRAEEVVLHDLIYSL